MSRSPLPTLHTPRLTLRPMAARDADDVYLMIRDSRPAFAAWFGWADASTRATVREYVQAAEEAMAVGSAWHYVALGGSGQLLARVGLTTIDRTNASAELGYMLRTDAEGRGLMTEAARGLLASALTSGGLHRVNAFVDCENARSRRVLDRLGFRREGTVRHMTRHPARGWRDHDAYGLLAGELRG